ncbi:hypothetical protein Anapl_02661 [Anas platyrhynchos]|uniref:Uncharacterized protein n=1 Tax=Anas platyrhynchos TaxID=8839 RepID=R0LB62_ANAPL|nr:hypothetical protein Anapl_02661 [Anas platyrhynchos]
MKPGVHSAAQPLVTETYSCYDYRAIQFALTPATSFTLGGEPEARSTVLPRAQSPTHGAAGAASSSVPLEELAEKPGTGMLGGVPARMTAKPDAGQGAEHITYRLLLQAGPSQLGRKCDSMGQRSQTGFWLTSPGCGPCNQQLASRCQDDALEPTPCATAEQGSTGTKPPADLCPRRCCMVAVSLNPELRSPLGWHSSRQGAATSKPHFNKCHGHFVYQGHKKFTSRGICREFRACWHAHEGITGDSTQNPDPFTLLSLLQQQGSIAVRKGLCIQVEDRRTPRETFRTTRCLKCNKFIKKEEQRRLCLLQTNYQKMPTIPSRKQKFSAVKHPTYPSNIRIQTMVMNQKIIVLAITFVFLEGFSSRLCSP